MEKNTVENLTNYIFSVQSLIDRLNIMQTMGKVDFTYINKRIEVIEKFEEIIKQIEKKIYGLEGGNK